MRVICCARVVRLGTFLSLLSSFLSLQAQVPTARPAQAVDNIRLDGVLDEASWELASPIGPLLQVEPFEGVEATEETEVRILYDSQALYFGIRCFDRTPSAIVSTQLARDSELEVDDHIAIALDPFFNQRSGFFFIVNPGGARVDGQISNNDEHPSIDWDGIWDVAARITKEGWQAEMVLPFKTLRFKPGLTVWGLNVQRVIKRHNEVNRWAGAKRDIWPSNLAEAGRLEGLPTVQQGLGLDVRPYGLIRRDDGEWEPDGGLDVSKNLAPNLNASLTVNTDFAETEVDSRQVNLTRFDLFYPEKRPFFLEGAGVFEVAGTSSRRPDLLPFFSRTIGLYEDHEVPIVVGGKLSGRQSGYNIGFLDVLTGGVGELQLPRQNLLVGRVSRDVWRQSYFGGIFTWGNPSGEGHNNLIGADARLATSTFRGDKNLSLDLYIFRTDDESSGHADYAGGFRLDYPNDLWDIVFSWKQIGEYFSPALGFVPRTGIRKADGGVQFRPRPQKFGIRQLSIEVRPQLITDLENKVEGWRLSTSPAEIEFDSGDRVNFRIAPENEVLLEPFEIAEGIVIPPGSYTWTMSEVELMSATKRPWVTEFKYGWGTFYSGYRKEVGAHLTVKPSSHFLLGFSGERNDLDLREGKFSTQIFSVRGDVNFSSNVTWANLVQYDSESRILGMQSRFRWILQPGSDLFVVLNRGWFRTFEHEYTPSFSRATVKLQYTFRF